jgi:hypothetical protein
MLNLRLCLLCTREHPKPSLRERKYIGEEHDGAEIQNCNYCCQSHFFIRMKSVKFFHGIWILNVKQFVRIWTFFIGCRYTSTGWFMV